MSETQNDIEYFLESFGFIKNDVKEINKLLLSIGYDLTTIKYFLEHDEIGLKKTCRKGKLSCKDLVLIDKLIVYYNNFYTTKNEKTLDEFKKDINEKLRKIKEKYIPETNVFKKEIIQADKNLCTDIMASINEKSLWKTIKTKSIYEVLLGDSITCLNIINKSEMRYIRNNSGQEAFMYR
jgi:hypothetical protein